MGRKSHAEYRPHVLLLQRPNHSGICGKSLGVGAYRTGEVCLERAAFSVQRSAFSVQRSAFSVQRSAFSVQRSAFSVQLKILNPLCLQSSKTLKYFVLTSGREHTFNNSHLDANTVSIDRTPC